jgi:hypothetical protein
MDDSNLKKAIETAGYLASAEMLAGVRKLLEQQLTPSLVARAHAQLRRQRHSGLEKP